MSNSKVSLLPDIRKTPWSGEGEGQESEPGSGWLSEKEVLSPPPWACRCRGGEETEGIWIMASDLLPWRGR